MKKKEKREDPYAERIYVKVRSDFDTTGYMLPRSITWTDGRVFPIDCVKGFRSAASVEARSSLTGDCYIVEIRGKVHHLFFERADPVFASRFGRWYVVRTEE